MNEIQLKYGCNPNQKPSRIYMEDGSDLPVKVLNGKPGYINFLDAFNGWQLVKELKQATGLPAATSFKHVSPAGAAVGLPLTETLAKIYWVDDLGELSPLACAYARARGADRMSSFGDFISLSDVCDVDTAKLIKREVSDGVIAPGYSEEALEILAQKKKGNYNVIQIDENYVPEPLEHKQVFGVTFEQGRQDLEISVDTMLQNFVTENKTVTDAQKRDLIMSLIVLKYTQSNSVCYVQDGQTIGVGQITCVDSSKLVERRDEFIAAMEKVKQNSNCDLVILMITDVLLDGSHIFYVGSDDVMQEAFSTVPKDKHMFLPKVMSRKKQIIPMLTAMWG